MKSARLPKLSTGVNRLGLPRRRRWWRRGVKWLSIIVGSLLFILLVTAAFYYPKAKLALAAARRAQTAAKLVPADLSQQHFTEAQKHLDDLQSALTETAQQLKRMQGLRHWPLIGRQYQAIEGLLVVGDDSAKASHALVNFLAQIFSPFSTRGKVSLASITPKEKGELLAAMANQEEPLRQAQASIHRAADSLDKIPSAGLIGPLHRIIGPLKEQFPIVTKALDQAIPATHLLPPVLGYPDTKTYLFLLLNNTELRPGGGFIGTYGLMKVYSGEIASLHTDNSYNLDDAAKGLPVITPPAPLQKYLKANAWYFRDSNWSPDFPTSAQQSLLFYQREGGSRNVDGVVAVTPTMIAALLRLVGPIKVGTLEFTADNFTDKLQKYVDVNYALNGQDASQRKDIIGTLTSELVSRLLKLPLAEWKDLFLVLSQQLNQKQFLLYMKDSALQSILQAQNWAGAIDETTTTDYLQVVDANLASLKTDPTIVRIYTYSVTAQNGQAQANLKIEYRHTGKFDWKTTRYNTYVRVYVPAGATLVSSQGAQRQEKSNRAGEVVTTTESGKTVFGAFKSIEPGTTSTLQLTYTLPPFVANQLEQQTYQLVWQKQPGMVAPNLNLTVNAPDHRPTLAAGLDNQGKLSHSGVSFVGRLDTDRRIIIRY